MKKLALSTLIVVLSAVQFLVAQERISLHTDFDMYFDNKEISKTNYAVQGVDIQSGTDFYGRLILSAELEWDRYNTLVVGGDFSNNYGENIDGFFSYAKPIIHYKYNSEKLKFVAGIFTNREMHIDSYSTAFYSETNRNVDNHVNGVLAQYNDGDSFVEVACNWSGEYSESSREKFSILSAGRHYLKTFYYGYNYLMYHYAGSMSEDEDSVVDIQMLNPCVGVRLGQDITVDIKLGAILTSQHDRSYSDSWERPLMGEAGVLLKYKGFSLDERLYIGDNINPFFYGHTLDNGYYMAYGRELYPNESFFRTEAGIYNRASLAYNRTMMSDKLRLRAEVVTHYDGYGFGTQYILSVGVNLFKDLYNAANHKSKR
ncbi:MAG: hypothetical protein SNG10_05410 [Rikenellaceae bacterium]